MLTQPTFVAIRADYYGDIGLPEHTAKMFYLFSTGKQQHIFNLNKLSPQNRRRLTLYPSSHEMTCVGADGYNAPDNRNGYDLTWACTDIPETIVEKLAQDQNVKIVFANSQSELSTMLHAIVNGKDPVKIVERDRRIYCQIAPKVPQHLIWQYTACTKPCLQ